MKSNRNSLKNSSLTIADALKNNAKHFEEEKSPEAQYPMASFDPIVQEILIKLKSNNPDTNKIIINYKELDKRTLSQEEKNAIFVALEQNRTVTNLWLQSLNLNDNDAIALAQALRNRGVQLSLLYLNYNKISGAGAEALRLVPTDYLGFTYNKLDDESITVFAKPGTIAVNVDIGYGSYSIKGINALGKANMKSNVLNWQSVMSALNGCKMESDEYDEIMATLQECHDEQMQKCLNPQFKKW